MPTQRMKARNSRRRSSAGSTGGTEPAYPRWIFFPRHTRPPEELRSVVECFRHAAPALRPRRREQPRSDEALACVARRLKRLGFIVEPPAGSTTSDEGARETRQKLRRPVLFGEHGEPQKSYECDAYHAGWRVVLEVEATRAVQGNQFYKDLFEACLMADADYLVVAVREETRLRTVRTRDYDRILKTLDTLYASERIQLPLKGVLLIGY